MFAINCSHYRKLKRIYDQAKSDPELFHPRVFRLLCRYDALGGPGYQVSGCVVGARVHTYGLLGVIQFAYGNTTWS
jgi:hypothetical protein